MDAANVRLLTEADAGAFFTLRLEGLENCPQAFGMSAETWRAFSLEAASARITPSPEGNFTLGAFSGGALVGTAGFVRLSGKEHHKGFVWGVYVTTDVRGQGIGKALLGTLIARAKTYPGLEQLTLTVATEQTAARRLYDALGFVVYGLERRALRLPDRDVDEEHRVLWLSPLKDATRQNVG